MSLSNATKIVANNLITKGVDLFIKNIHKFSATRNSLQYLISAALFYNIYGKIDLIAAGIGLVGFITAYQSVYYYNDLVDLKEDKKDAVKRAIKPLARGEAALESYVTKLFVYSILGLFLCFSINWVLGAAVTLAVFLNFLHSFPLFRIKNTPFVGLNLFVIEALKFSAGWFALSGMQQLFQLPIGIIGIFAATYVFGYFVYRKNIVPKSAAKRDVKKETMNLAFFSALTIIFFIASYMLYDLKTQLAVLAVSSSLFLIPVKSKSMEKLTSGAAACIFVYTVFILSLLFL